MTTSSLTIRIDSTGLSTIYGAGQSVTLACGVQQMVNLAVVNAAGARHRTSPLSAGASPLIVAWLALASPMQSNTIAWTDQYYCYATTTPNGMGRAIMMNAQSQVPAQPGQTNTFKNGAFVATAGSGTSYAVANGMTSLYGLGLARQAVVNGVNALAPVCCAQVLPNQTAYFTPGNEVAIYLSSAAQNATFMPPPQNAQAIAVGANSVVGFNDQTDMFYQIS